MREFILMAVLTATVIYGSEAMAQNYLSSDKPIRLKGVGRCHVFKKFNIHVFGC